MFNFLEYISDVLNVLYAIGGFILSLWWIWIPWFLFILARDLFLKYKRDEFIQDMEWVLLEVIPPSEILKTPRAMEQFFAGLHGTQSTPNWRDLNIKGNTQKWFSFEIISKAGEIHFLIKTPSLFRDLIEANIYAQYPEAEISQVDDYVDSVPNDLLNEDYDLWGTELVLLEEDAYPIRTYVDFEKDAMNDDQRIDPMSSILEVMNKIGPEEQIWIQTLARPVLDEWKEKGEELRDELIGRKEEKKESEIIKEMKAWKDAGKEVSHQLITGNPLESDSSLEDKKNDTPFLWKSTKAEQDIINSIEQNISKIGYEVIIRFVYLAKKEAFKRPNVAAIIGSFKQFNTQNLNGFKPNGKVTPNIDYEYQGKKQREYYRKKRVFDDYKKRNFIQQSKYISYLKPLFFERWPILNWFFIRSEPFVFNIEELATVYHFPIATVKAPFVPKVGAKKSEPPVGLPMK